MTDEQDQPRPQRHEEVGSLGEEAARLLGALSHWAQEHTEDPGAATGSPSGAHADHGPFDDLAAAVRDGEAPLATGSAECRWCPVCRVVHAVRQTSPEVREHLAAAAGSLLEAASSLLATQVPTDDRDRDRDPGTGGLDRIDLDGASAEEWGDEGPSGSERSR